MKRFLMLCLLPLLIACGTNPAAVPTITPRLLTPTQESTAQIVPPPATIPAPTETSAPRSFPNADHYQWTEIISGLKRPVDIQFAQGKMFIIEKHGYIRVVEQGQLRKEPFLNIIDRVDDKGNEMGLLGLAFHPNFADNGYLYVNYTGTGGHTRISRFYAHGDFANSGSEKVLLTIKQPFANHNGGVLAFGPDGYLYAGLGDGGSAGDPYKNGQNTQSLLGKILRMNVNHGEPYTIPSDNPFDNEVWAYGLRNPWRFSFDRVTGDLWIGDVGQNQWEEVDYLPKGQGAGANFGWSVIEGNHNYDGEFQPGMLLPVAEYSHNEGCSITGGYVYRGTMTEWDGIYLYGDYCTGKIWGLILVNGVWQNELLFQTGELITTFGQDEAGEMYFASDRGSVYHLTKK